MTERWVPEIMGQCRSLDDVGVAAAQPIEHGGRGGIARQTLGDRRLTWATCRLCA